MTSKIGINDEEYIKCYNDSYIKSCKIAELMDDSSGRNTCNDIDWDTQTRINVGYHCRKKLNLNSNIEFIMNKSK